MICPLHDRNYSKNGQCSFCTQVIILQNSIGQRGELMNCCLPHGGYSIQSQGCPSCLQIAGMQNALGQQHAYTGSGSTETELERLVRVANEGLMAVKSLVEDHRSAVEYTMDDDGTYALYELPQFMFRRQFRIKPKQLPLPEPIYVGPTQEPRGHLKEHKQVWKVELSEDRKTVTVGCQSFDASMLRIGLALLCKDRESLFRQGGMDLCATRDGVEHTKGHLSWTDADRLLAYLEEGLKE